MSDFLDEGGREEPESDVLLGDPSRVVTARGTEDGLVLRIDGKAEWSEVLGDLDAFLGGRKKFFEGGQVSIEWLERLPTKEQSNQLELVLKEQYGMEIVTRRRRPTKRAPERATEEGSDASSAVTIPLFEEVRAMQDEYSDKDSLFDELDVLSLTAPEAPQNERRHNERTRDARGGQKSSLHEQVERFTSEALGSMEESGEGGSPEQLRRKYINRVARLLGEELYYDDEANAKIVYGTLRSGQRVESPYSLIVIGDVNPGADLAAGGDIIVLGSLRGTAHASAYDDDSFDRVIIALQMQPMQLRIGSVISRGSEDVVHGAEIARIENRRIIVEPFNPRKLFNRKLR